VSGVFFALMVTEEFVNEHILVISANKLVTIWVTLIHAKGRPNIGG
jgi:hypothetical protein